MSAATAVTERELADVCVDCGVDEHCAYHVHGRVWQSARLSKEQPCCLDCLGERLGRDLTFEDFDLCSPCNLFVPFKIKKKILYSLVRAWLGFMTNGRPTSDDYVCRVTNSVLKMRRKHPHGLTLREVLAWTVVEFGVKYEIATTAREIRSQCKEHSRTSHEEIPDTRVRIGEDQHT